MTEWFKVDQIGVAHEDKRRAIIAVFNGDFVARQIKILKIKEDSILGNHYHNYRELFFVIDGHVCYYLEDVLTGEKHSGELQGGQRLVIQPKVAHKAEMSAGTLTLEATEELYISPEKNDERYNIEWVRI